MPEHILLEEFKRSLERLTLRWKENAEMQVAEIGSGFN
jgi:hypothetical protein